MLHSNSKLSKKIYRDYSNFEITALGDNFFRLGSCLENKKCRMKRKKKKNTTRTKIDKAIKVLLKQNKTLTRGIWDSKILHIE